METRRRTQKAAKENLSKQRRKYKARRILQEMQKVKSKQIVCHDLYCEREGETTSDRQKWKEEFESTGGGYKLAKMNREHIEADRKLRGKSGDEQ